jgi:hypothetical protein
MLAVLNLRLPLAQLGQAAQACSASAAIEPALATGLVAWEPTEPSCPVELGAVPDAGRGIPGLTLRQAVEATEPSPLLGAMELSSGHFAEAVRMLTGALAQMRDDPGSWPVATLTAGWLCGTHLLLGDGESGASFARWALGTGCLDPPAVSWTRTEVAIS